MPSTLPAGNRRPRIRTMAALVVLAAALSAAPLGAAQARPRVPGLAGSPFANLAGSWAGRGTITTLTGVEHAACAATYAVAGRTVRLAIACASEHFRLDLATAVAERDGTVSGTWADRVFGSSGTVTGRAGGDRLDLAASVMGTGVSLVIVTRGPRQTVSLTTANPLITDGTLLLGRRR